MSNYRTITTAAALAGAAVLGVVATSAAQAGQAEGQGPWCTGSDLAIGVYDMRSPSPSTTKAHVIRFVAAEGASCTIGGTVSNVRFLDQQGNDMNASQNGGQPPYTEMVVGGGRHAVTYVASSLQGPQLSPAFVRFNLPGQGRTGDLVTIAWPTSGIGANVRMGGIQAPVS
ncbi:hypothetical protein [Lentzea aerocolonigenes]|uniref:hypothetical protein n=1 Tax=Lentzea aerocolonigenes TaxID=68170 RepID=UPI0004C2BF2F|nr:hypothetical protein [Lentzea aerocolonigenes]MCP2248397.1 hypothetical protein [Lentzea aerocolonigenes]